MLIRKSIIRSIPKAIIVIALSFGKYQQFTIRNRYCYPLISWLTINYVFLFVINSSAVAFGFGCGMFTNECYGE